MIKRLNRFTTAIIFSASYIKTIKWTGFSYISIKRKILINILWRRQEWLILLFHVITVREEKSFFELFKINHLAYNKMTKSHDSIFMFLTKPKNAWLNADADDVNRKYECWIDYYFNVVSLYALILINHIKKQIISWYWDIDFGKSNQIQWSA